MHFLHYLILQAYESVGFLYVTLLIANLALPLQVIGIVALVIGVLNDIGIAISLCYYLQSMRSSFSEYVFSFPVYFFFSRL